MYLSLMIKGISLISNSNASALVRAAAAVAAIVSTASQGHCEKTIVQVRGGKMELRMQDGKLALTGLQGSVGGGNLRMDGHVEATPDAMNRADMKFADVPLTDAAKFVAGPNAPAWLSTIQVSGSVNAQWQGKGMKDISRTAAGKVTLESGPGVITDEATLANLGKVLRTGKLPELRYTSLKLTASAENGTLIIDKLTAEGPHFTLNATGNYSTMSDSLDLRIDLTVSNEMARKSSYMKIKNVMDWFSTDSKPAEESGAFVEVPRLLVTGSLKKPKVKMSDEKPAAETAAADSDSTFEASGSRTIAQAVR